MAVRHPGIFSAAIPISAPADPSLTLLIKDVPLFIIHGDLDEIYPVSEVKNLYERQKMRGAEIKLMIVEMATHHELAPFIPPLTAAIPWLKRIWEDR